jgi:hypothetical protein
MQPRFKSVMNGQGVKHTRLQGKVASEFSTYIVFPPYKDNLTIFDHKVGQSQLIWQPVSITMTIRAVFDCPSLNNFDILQDM